MSFTEPSILTKFALPKLPVNNAPACVFRVVGIKAKTVQDVTANAHLRLTADQANRLLKAPNANSLVGMRDKAIFALMLATGLRADELTALTVSDLRQQTADGELALLVQEGKGDKQRLIPYGDLDECLAVVGKWLTFAGISEGVVFRAVLKSGRVASKGLTVRSIENFLNSYPIVIAGNPRQIKPHDLRRTYAARMYEAGMDIVAIQQNLGHADLKTTQTYIGDLGGKARRGKAVFDFGA